MENISERSIERKTEQEIVEIINRLKQEGWETESLQDRQDFKKSLRARFGNLYSQKTVLSEIKLIDDFLHRDYPDLGKIKARDFIPKNKTFGNINWAIKSLKQLGFYTSERESLQTDSLLKWIFEP